MATYMDIEEIRAKYHNGDYSCSFSSIPNMIDCNYIFDENLSVKRNREMIREHNDKVMKMKKELMMKDNELHSKLRKDVIEYIINVYNMSESQACIIESWVYNEKHSFMNDYFNGIDEIAELVESVLNANEDL